MSRVGRQPITIPEGITVRLEDDALIVADAKNNSFTFDVLEGVTPVIEDHEVRFELATNNKQGRSNWGTLRAIVQNAVTGLTEGFHKTLLLEGVGYRITAAGNDLDLALGFSHPVTYKAPEGITFEVEGNNKVTVRGASKELVGKVAAEIRSLRPVEPYKGKGFRYEGEIVRRKAGKKTGAGE